MIPTETKYKKWIKAVTTGDKWLFYFLFTFVITLIELCTLPGIITILSAVFVDSGYFFVIGSSLAFCLPPIAAFLFGYLGLYQTWKDLK